MVVYDLYGEKLLLQKIADGSEQAFRKVFELYKSRVYTFVVHFTKSDADAEEIVQDTFLTIWQKRDDLLQIEHPRNYIYTVARHKTYDHLRKLARNEKLLRQHWESTQIHGNVTEEFLDVREHLHFIHKALAQLSAQKQLIFKLSRFEGKGHLEIAATTGLSKSRVKNIIVEVNGHIKSYLKEHSLFLSVLFACLLAG